MSNNNNVWICCTLLTIQLAVRHSLCAAGLPLLGLHQAASDYLPETCTPVSASVKVCHPSRELSTTLM